MNKIKAVFFDVDGTLFSHSLKKIPESTMESLDLLREQGIQIFVATGRSLSEMDKMSVGDIDFDGYVTLNGQACYDRDRNPIYQSNIEDEDTEIIVKLFNEKKIPIAIVKEDDLYLNFVNEYVEKVQADITSEIPEVGEYHGEKVCQYIFYTTPEETKEKIADTKMCKIHQWNEYAVDVLHINSGKDVSIERVLKHYGFTREEIMVFGDGENDIDMIVYAGIGVAMGNAGDEVKRHADYVTSHIDEDGIKNALKQFGII